MHFYDSFRIILEKSIENERKLEQNPINVNSERPQVKESLISYLTSRVPKDFFNRLPEALEAAYFQASTDAAQKCGEPERVRVRGQLRHYYQNKAMRDVAELSSIEAFSPHTDPKGERFTLLSTNEVSMGRTAVPFANKVPSAAKHRKMIAAVNSRLEPSNFDLFSDASARKSAEGLGVLIVTVHSPKGMDQSVPSHFVVGVPYSNMKGWHLFEPLSVILAAYEPGISANTIDTAFPTLKRQLRDAEDGK